MYHVNQPLLYSGPTLNIRMGNCHLVFNSGEVYWPTKTDENGFYVHSLFWQHNSADWKPAIVANSWVNIQNRAYFVLETVGGRVRKTYPDTLWADEVSAVTIDATKHRHWPVMQQWLAGEKIETRFLGDWVVVSIPTWEKTEYRVKPNVKAGDWVSYQLNFSLVEKVEHDRAYFKGRRDPIRASTLTAIACELNKHWPLMQQWAKGAEIELKSHFNGDWVSCLSPSWSKNAKYRLKSIIKVGDWVYNGLTDEYLYVTQAFGQTVQFKGMDTTEEIRPHHTVVNPTIHSDWPLMQQWAEGLDVEVQLAHGHPWIPIKTPAWSWKYSYRAAIKVGDWVQRNGSTGLWLYVVQVNADTFLAKGGERYNFSDSKVVDPKTNPHWPLMQQWLEGAEIQFRTRAGNWYTIEIPSWDAGMGYRVSIKVRDWVVNEIDQTYYVTELNSFDKAIFYGFQGVRDLKGFKKLDVTKHRWCKEMQAWMKGATVELGDRKVIKCSAFDWTGDDYRIVEPATTVQCLATNEGVYHSCVPNLELTFQGSKLISAKVINND